MTLKKASLLILLVLIIDQWSKIYIKTHFQLGESVEVFSWFKIHFVENPGMAWGMELPGTYGKLFLSLFRLGAIGAIGYWLWDSIRKKASNILITCIALIFAGALGNQLDSTFYGLFFDHSNRQVASFLPETFRGGTYFSFFDPVFNVADSAICVAVVLLIIFNKTVFPKEEKAISAEA